MLIENILGGDWCICPLSFVPYKGCLKSLFTFYGGNEHQIGHPGKPKLFVSSRKNVSFDSQKIFPFMGKSKFYNFQMELAFGNLSWKTTKCFIEV